MNWLTLVAASPFALFAAMFGFGLAKWLRDPHGLEAKRFRALTLVGAAGWLIWVVVLTWLLTDFGS